MPLAPSIALRVLPELLRLVVAVEPREGPAYNAKCTCTRMGTTTIFRYDRSIGSGGDGLIEYPEQLLMLENALQVIIYSVPSASLTSQQLAYIETAESLGMRVVVIELDTMLDGTLAQRGVHQQTTLLGKVLTAKSGLSCSPSSSHPWRPEGQTASVSASERRPPPT